jgi:hypothetical protein
MDVKPTKHRPHRGLWVSAGGLLVIPGLLASGATKVALLSIAAVCFLCGLSLLLWTISRN